MIEAMDHSFRPYGGEEMICRRCDFVIWAVADQGEAERAVKLLNGTWCREYMPDDWRALAAATGTAKTAEQAECEASQSGGSGSERNAQTQSPSTPDNKDKPNA